MESAHLLAQRRSEICAAIAAAVEGSTREDELAGELLDLEEKIAATPSSSLEVAVLQLRITAIWMNSYAFDSDLQRKALRTIILALRTIEEATGISLDIFGGAEDVPYNMLN